jgi:hypothetical protein
MKVETDLKVGATLQEVAQSASQAVAPVGEFFSKAGDQAESLTTPVVEKVVTFWNCLRGS